MQIRLKLEKVNLKPVQEKFVDAVENYREVLRSASEHEVGTEGLGWYTGQFSFRFKLYSVQWTLFLGGTKIIK